MVSDRPFLNESISNGTINHYYRTGAIKSCTNGQTTSSSFGQLLGHQIGLADYNTILGEFPTEDELVWLPGVGATTEVTGAVNCTVNALNTTNYLEKWVALFNTQTGLFKTELHMSDGQVFDYGFLPETLPEGTKNMNRTLIYNYEEPVSGIWGFED